jgi:hypothetical protein
VTGLELLGCVAGKRIETETRINLTASIHEWRRICMGCMENGDLSRVRSLEMTALLMNLNGAAFIEGRWSARKVASGGSQGRKGRS